MTADPAYVQATQVTQPSQIMSHFCVQSAQGMYSNQLAGGGGGGAAGSQHQQQNVASPSPSSSSSSPHSSQPPYSSQQQLYTPSGYQTGAQYPPAQYPAQLSSTSAPGAATPQSLYASSHGSPYASTQSLPQLSQLAYSKSGLHPYASATNLSHGFPHQGAAQSVSHGNFHQVAAPSPASAASHGFHKGAVQSSTSSLYLDRGPSPDGSSQYQQSQGLYPTESNKYQITDL